MRALIADEIAVLWSLWDGGTVADVAYDLGMSRQYVGSILSVLQARGLIARWPGRRRRQPSPWSLTEAGVATIDPGAAVGRAA